MQLILTQTDIELALKNYVNEILTVREGMVITVDLKATRGADGATAIIDISPAGESTAKAEPVKPNVVTNKPAASREVTAAKSEVVKDDKPAKAEEPEPETQAAEESQPAEVAADTNAAEEASEQQAEPAVNAEPEAEAEQPATTKPQSLFAGLRKPKND